MTKLISKQEVANIAHLARLCLADQELEVLAKDLEDILLYVNKLTTLDTQKVEPTTHVLPLKNVLREDAVKPSLSQDEALSISVEQQAGSFKVPQVIE